MKKIIFSIVLLLGLLLSGCVPTLPTFTEVKLENEYINYDENIVINFGVTNNGQTSFNPLIEVFKDDPEECFYAASKELDPILPGKKVIDSITVRTQRNVNCRNNDLDIFLVLKDKNSGESRTHQSPLFDRYRLVV